MEAQTINIVLVLSVDTLSLVAKEFCFSILCNKFVLPFLSFLLDQINGFKIMDDPNTSFNY